MRLDMADLDHPAEQVLERFLLNHCSQNELCEVETHILHCEGCLARLELLELQITAFKLCLQMMLNRELTMPTPESDRIQELGLTLGAFVARPA